MVKKSDSTKKSDKKTFKGLFIGLIIAAAVVVIAGGVCLFIFSRPNPVGTYKLTGIERDGEDQSDTIEIFKSFGKTATMELKDDKTGNLDLFDEKSSFTYDDKEIKEDNRTFAYEFKDNKISMVVNGSTLTFTKD